MASSVADPDPGSGAFLSRGSGIGKKSGSGSGMKNPDYITESLETRDPGRKKIRIRGGKNSDPGYTFWTRNTGG